MRRLLLRAVRLGTDPAAGSTPLKDISLRIFAGDFTAILGAPGSGKGALLRVLGLLDRPSAGDLYLEGRLVTGLPAADLADLRSTLVCYLPPGSTRLPNQPILLVDDPTRGQVQTLEALNESGRTVVFATADPELAAHGNSICRLSDGTLVMITPE